MRSSSNPKSVDCSLKMDIFLTTVTAQTISKSTTTCTCAGQEPKRVTQHS